MGGGTLFLCVALTTPFISEDHSPPAAKEVARFLKAPGFHSPKTTPPERTRAVSIQPVRRGTALCIGARRRIVC